LRKILLTFSRQPAWPAAIMPVPVRAAFGSDASLLEVAVVNVSDIPGNARGGLKAAVVDLNSDGDSARRRAVSQRRLRQKRPYARRDARRYNATQRETSRQSLRYLPPQ
jgi:hypothetical protein